MKNIKSLFKNKVITTLLIVSFVTIIVDMIVNGAIQTILANDYLKTVVEDPNTLIQALFKENAFNYLISGLVGEQTLNVTIEKSGLLIAAYAMQMAIGLLQLGLASTLVYLSAREAKSKKFLILTTGVLFMFMAVNGIAMSAINFNEGTSREFSYLISRFGKDSEYINGIFKQWSASSAGQTVLGLISAEITTAHGLDIAAAATGSVEAQQKIAEIARLMATGMTQESALNIIYGAAASNKVLVDISSATSSNTNYANFQLYRINVMSVSSYLDSTAGASFMTDINAWLGNADYQNILKWVFSGTGIFGMVAMTFTGYAIANQVYSGSSSDGNFFKRAINQANSNGNKTEKEVKKQKEEKEVKIVEQPKERKTTWHATEPDSSEDLEVVTAENKE